MNVLQTTNQLTAQAILNNVPELLSKGSFVVVEFSGLQAVGCEIFSGAGAAERAHAKLEELNASSNSTHGELHEPPTEYIGEIRTKESGGGSGCAHSDDHMAQRFGIAA